MSEGSNQVPVLIERTSALAVTDADSYREAAILVRELRAMKATVEETFAEPKALAHQAHKAIIASEKRHLERLEAAEGELRSMMVQWANAAEVVAEKRTQEARRIMLEEARQASIQTASKLIANGQREDAVRCLSHPIQLAREPVWPSAVPKLKGVSIRRSWKAEVSDPLALLVWAAKNRRVDLFKPVQKTLDSLARQGSGTGAPPGVRFSAVTSVAIGEAKR